MESFPPAPWSKKLCNSKPYQTTISVLVDIFYHPNSSYFDKTGLFQQPQALALKIHVRLRPQIAWKPVLNSLLCS
jgi:hypothetical protein